MLEPLKPLLDHPLFPVIIVIVLVIWVMIAYSRGTRAERFEQKLATSKIDSTSVGIVELVGYVKAINTCEIPLFKRECVGYSYAIERIRRDSEKNRDSYHLKYTENHIEPFYLEDDTGKILVEPQDLIAESLSEDFNYQHSSDYRHRCSYLKNNEKVMIIGRAEPRGGELVLVADEQHKLFSLKPYSAVVSDRASKPLMARGLIYLLVAATVSTLIVYL